MGRIISGALPASRGGRIVDLRAGHGARVLVVPHSASCLPCREYLATLAGTAGIFDWGGRLTVIMRDALDAADTLHESLGGRADILLDPARSIPLGDGALAVTDEWGEVYFETGTGAGHEWPPVTEVVNWVRFVSIQCPECVNTEGDWRFL